MKNQIGQLPGSIVSRHFLCAFVLLLLATACLAQVSTGSNGHDGPLNPTANKVINMADHPDGIYQYTSVNIPANVTVTFVPNANNTPVTWLVQGAVVIAGSVNVSGGGLPWGGNIGVPGLGGPGGGSGGYPGQGNAPLPQPGAGLGGGVAGSSTTPLGGGGSDSTLGEAQSGMLSPPGLTYGNKYLLPLLGGSGGGGSWPKSGVDATAGGGGGGAIRVCVGHLDPGRRVSNR